MNWSLIVIFHRTIQGYPFQIGYSELNCITGGNSTLPTFTLYLVAATDKERSEWIKAIRKGEIESFIIVVFNVFNLS